MEIIKRQSIIIWLYSTKNIKPLRKHGYVHYVSRKMKYAILYVDQRETEQAMTALKGYHFVRDVELSYRDNIDMTFEHAIEPSEGVIIEDDLLLPEEDGSFFENIAKSIKKQVSKEEQDEESK